MNIMTRTKALVAQATVITPTSIKVCMHALSSARIDVRAMRASSALIEEGFAVTIVDIESERIYPAEEDMNGIHMKHMHVPNSFTATRFKRWVLIRTAWMFMRSVLHLLWTPADIFHALDLAALPACYIAAQLRGKPLIFESYELPLSTLPLSEMSISRRCLQMLLAHMLAYIIPRCAGVIAVSPPIVQEMSKRYHCSNITMVRNIPLYQAVAKSNRLRQRLDLGPQVRIALYQGYLQPDRGLDKLVRAAVFLEEHIVIVMMGKDMVGTQAQLERLIDSEGVADRVKIIPPVPHQYLLSWSASADIGLIVYTPDYSMNVQMMLPNKFFEFLMAGLPILASELGPIAEVIRTYEVGHVITSLAPADVGAAINAMLANHDNMARMRCNALDAAQQEFNWEKERYELISLYDNILIQQNTKYKS